MNDEERLAQAEEGRDTLGELPGSPSSAASTGGGRVGVGARDGGGMRPSLQLHGLDREFSTRFGGDSSRKLDGSISQNNNDNNSKNNARG